MDATPKPKPPVQKLVPIQPTAKESKPSVKKPFVRKDHLTQRPFASHPDLVEMKRKAEEAKANHPSSRNNKRR